MMSTGPLGSLHSRSVVMDLSELSLWLTDFAPKICLINGSIFIDRGGKEELLARVEQFSSTEEAQYWINTILIDDFINSSVGYDWSVEDKFVEEILNSYKRSIVAVVKSDFPNITFEVETFLSDSDVGLRIKQYHF